MRERGDLLEEDPDTGVVREGFARYKRAAGAAGYDTTNPAVQVALLHAWIASGVASIGMSLVEVLQKAVDELRRSRRGGMS